MSKRHTPVFLTQKEYDELLESADLKLDKALPGAEFKPVGRVEYSKNKHKHRPRKSGSTEVL